MPLARKKAARKRLSLPKAESVSETDIESVLSFNNSKPTKPYTLILTILLIIAAFFIGMLYTKVQYLQNNQTQQQNTVASGTAPSGAPSPLNIARQIGMDPNKFKSCLESNKYATAVSNDLADGQKAGVTGTPTTFIDGYPIVGAEPYSVFQALIDQELIKSQSGRLPQNSLFNNTVYAQTIPISISPTPSRVSVEPGNLPILGNKNAPVTIIEFADFQCPFCERWFNGTEGQIIKNYVDSGKAKFIFRNYAFLGQDSVTAAEGAYCANEQGKFWQYHDFMYSHQGQENSGWTSKRNLE